MSANYSYMEEMSTPELHLPGFRFHPTEEELLGFYLKNIVFGKSLSFDIIGFLNIYHHDPWDLPGLAKNVGEREWYFFVPIDRKHGSGGRPNRTTEKGYWKATGSDRKVVSLISEPKRVLGLRKTLVFYKGRAPKGTKTDWVMNEYRLPDNCKLLKEIVMCKVYRKATSLKVLEQRAAMEEEMKIINTCCSSSSIDSFSFCGPQEEELMKKVSMNQMTLKKEEEEEEEEEEELVVSKNKIDEKGIENIKGSFSKPMLQIGMDYNLPEIQVPKLSMDFCNQDQFWAQLNSPWLQNLTPIFNILNF